MQYTFQYVYVNISVAEMLSVRRRRRLVQLANKLNQVKYKTVSEKHILPFLKTFHSVDGKFIKQLDWCIPNRTSSLYVYIMENGEAVFAWPAQSSDLNLIENVRLIMKRRLRALHMYPSNGDTLFEQSCKIWNELSDSYFNALVASIECRYSRGRSSKY